MYEAEVRADDGCRLDELIIELDGALSPNPDPTNFIDTGL